MTARLADATLVGFVNVAWDGADHAFLLDPKVRPDHQRRGIGTELVRRAALHAKRAGCEWLEVDFDEDGGLEPFYFQRVGSVRRGLGSSTSLSTVWDRERTLGLRKGILVALRIGNITLDCDDVLAVAQFWSQALGRPLDSGGSPGFASIGGADAQRVEPAWYFEKVPEPKQAKNRMHLDLIDPDPSAVQRLVGLGATVVAERAIQGGAHRWTVMQDPEGNEFCVAARSFTG